jgi:WD40 repeat protein
MKNPLSVGICLVCLVLFGSIAITAQTANPSPTPTAIPPPSDVFLVDVTDTKAKIKLGQPQKISTTTGYNNQPSFTPDGQSILYTSIRDRQADIYRYELSGGTTTQVTNTPESEYSPTVMPDARFLSVVRVEADGTQRLWKFPLAGGEPSLILENVKPVGYHLWLDERALALFILGKPNTLQIADIVTGKTETIADNPGRVLRRIPHDDKFSFVHKVGNDWIIKAVEVKSKKISEVAKTMPGVEDYAWLPSGVILMGRQSKIYQHKKGDWAWEEVADFSNVGLKNITRIAVSPKGDRIAIVAQRR